MEFAWGLIDLRMFTDDSEIGGEGGVAVDDARDGLAGGVANTGEDVAVPGERSKISKLCGVAGLRWYKGVGFRRRIPCPSVFRSFSWMISASIFRSDSSSRRRWLSMRSCSRSCSPFLISSSSKTPRSMPMLYLDSMSSRDEVVFRAWRS